MLYYQLFIHLDTFPIYNGNRPIINRLYIFRKRLKARNMPPISMDDDATVFKKYADDELTSLTSKPNLTRTISIRI